MHEGDLLGTYFLLGGPMDFKNYSNGNEACFFSSLRLLKMACIKFLIVICEKSFYELMNFQCIDFNDKETFGGWLMYGIIYIYMLVVMTMIYYYYYYY